MGFTKENFLNNFDLLISNFRIFYYLILILEYNPLFIGMLEATYFESQNPDDYIELLKYLRYISPLNYLKQILTCTGTGMTTDCSFGLPFYLLTTLGVYVVLALVMLCVGVVKIKRNKLTGKFFINLMSAVVNLVEFFLNVFGICMMFVLVNQIVMIFQNNLLTNLENSLISIILYSINFLIFIAIYSFYIKTNNMIMTYDKSRISFKDSLFAPKYYYFLLLLKFMVCLKDSLLLANHKLPKNYISMLLLLFIVLFNMDIFINFCKKKPLFMINYSFNILRLTFIVLLFLQALWKFCLRDHAVLNYITIPNFAFCLVFSFVYVKIANENIIVNSDLLNQLVLIVNEIIFNQENADKLIRRIHFHNILNFGKSEKNKSKIYRQHENLEFGYKILDKLEKIIREDYEKKIPKYTIDVVKVCSLILFRIDPTKKNKFIFSIKKELLKRHTFPNDFLYNIISVYYNTRLGDDFHKVSKINKIVDTYINSNHIMEKITTYFSRILENSPIIFNETFYNSVSFINKAKLQLNKNLKYLLNKRSTNIDNFNFFTLYYSYELAFKESIKEVEFIFPVEEIVDSLKRHYNKDSILCACYNLKNNEIRIMNYSRDFHAKKGENLSSIFPSILQYPLMDAFIKKIEVEFKSDIDLYYYDSAKFEVKKFNFEFITYQNLGSDTIFIKGAYNFAYDHLMITRTIDDVETIETYSMKWIKIAGLNPKILDFFKRKSTVIVLKSFLTSYVTEGKDAMTLYKPNEEFLKSINCDKYIMESGLIDFNLNLISQYNDDRGVIKIYVVVSNNQSFSEIVAGAIRMMKRSNLFTFFKQFLVNTIKKVLQDTDDEQLGDENSNSNLQEHKEKFEERKLTTSGIRKLSILTLIYNAILIIYCVVFLVIGIQNTSVVKDFYNFKASFENLRFFWYHTTLSLYQNVLLYRKSTFDITTYTSGPDYFSKFHSPDIPIDVAAYCVEEIPLKLDLLKDIVTSFQETLSNFSQKDKFLTEFGENVDVYILRNGQNGIFIDKHSYTFFNGLSTLVSWGYTFFEPGTSYTEVWIITFLDGKYDLSNIITDSLPVSKMSEYDTTINFATFQRKFDSLSVSIDNSFNATLDNVSNTNVVLSVVLIILHILYIVLCGYILGKFKSYMTKYNYIITFFMNDDNIRNMNQKILLLKGLNRLYTQNPIKELVKLSIVTKNEKDKFNLLKKRLQNNQDLFLSQLDNLKNVHENDQMSEFKYVKEADAKPKLSLIISFTQVLVTIFLIYAIFFVLTFYFLMVIFNIFLETKNYSDKFMTTKINNINNALIIQTITHNNATDSSMNQFMNGDGTKGFLRENFKQSYEYIETLQKLETSSSLQSVITYSNSLTTCENIYKSTDQIYSKFNSTVINSLINVCNVFKFTNTGTLYNFDYELLYLSRNLIDLFEQANFDYIKLKIVWDAEMFYDNLLVNNLIMRPITDYLYGDVLYNIVMSNVQFFIYYSIFYLICNMIADIMISFFVNRYVISKIKEADDQLKEFLFWI